MSKEWRKYAGEGVERSNFVHHLREVRSWSGQAWNHERVWARAREEVGRVRDTLVRIWRSKKWM